MEQSQLWLQFRHKLCGFRGSNLRWFFLWMICTVMPSWSSCDCPSRLIGVGQSRSQALHTKGFSFFISAFYQAATKFHKSPVLNGDCEVPLPQRVPSHVKTGGRNPGESPLKRNLQVGADFYEEAVELSTPLSCWTRAMLFERTEAENEKRGGWRYLKAVRGMNWGVWRNPH